jgi:hypothetical protein
MAEVAVPLRGFGLIPVVPLKLLWRLEELGCDPKVVAGQFMYTEPTSIPWGAKERALVAEHKRNLKRLVTYVEHDSYPSVR